MKQEYLQELERALSGLIVHEKFLPEILELISKRGIERRFFTIFIRRLDFLLEHGRNAQEYSREFERLDQELYSMHVQGKNFNIRVLYSFLPDGTILLHPFYEREGKKHTDYSTHKAEALRRKHEMED